MSQTTPEFTKDEQLIAESLLDARKVQEYIWEEISFVHDEFDPEIWRYVFQKRVDRISNIDPKHPYYKVELRKRVLQQAALSICALRVLDSQVNPSNQE